MKNIVALQTARAGSKSVPNKNMADYQNLPLFIHNLINARRCTLINQVYVSTDDKSILEHDFEFKETYKTIKRPASLCKDNSSHQETIVHGLDYIEDDMGKKVDILVVLLGNTPHAYTHDLQDAIAKFQKDFDKWDSCMSVGVFNMFNPYRAFHQLQDGSIVPIVDSSFTDFMSNRQNRSNKDAFGDTYFFNGSFWLLKPDVLRKNEGKSVFPWLGNKIMPFEQNSECQEIDDFWQLKLLKG